MSSGARRSVGTDGGGGDCPAASAAAAAAGLLRDREDIIAAQARRIEELERETERVRRERDGLATKLTLLTYKLEMYSKDLHDARRRNLAAADQSSSHHRR